MIDVEVIRTQAEKKPFHETVEEAVKDLEAYGPLAGWKLNEHIVEGHFLKTRNALFFGVPDFDLLVAVDMKLSLRQTVNALYGLIEHSDELLAFALPKFHFPVSALKRAHLRLTPYAYKYFATMTLNRIGELGLEDIDYSQIERATPKLIGLKFDPKRDSFDPVVEGY